MNWKLCGRKRRYPTEAMARGYGAAWENSAYHCNTCGDWHLTSQRAEDKVKVVRNPKVYKQA